MKDKKTWIGVFVTLLAFYFFYRTASKVDFSKIKESLAAVNYLYLFPAVFFIILSVWIRAPRWRIFLNDTEGKIPLNSLFRIALIGFMCNSIFPARLGEIVRPLVLSKKEKIPFSFVLSTVALERVFDLFALVVSLTVVLLIWPFPSNLVETEESKSLFLLLHKAGYTSAGMLIAFSFIIFFVLKYPQKTTTIIDKLPIFSDKIKELAKQILEHVLAGFECVKSPKAIVLCCGYSMLVWFTIFFSEYMIFLGFDLSLNFWAAAFIGIAIAFGVAAPSTPGYLGVFHVVCQVVLIGFFAVDEGTATGVAIIMHAYQWIFIILGGLIVLPFEGLSFKDLKKTRQEQPAK